MKILSAILCLVCLMTTMLDESDAFSGSFGSRNQDRVSAPSITITGYAPGDINKSVVTGQIPRTQLKPPLFVASRGATNEPERLSLRQRLRKITNLKVRLHVALLLFTRRLSELFHKVRVPLAVCIATVVLRFGGLPSLAPSPAHAAKPTTTISKTVSNRQQWKEKEAKAGTGETKRSVLSNVNRSKQRLVLALGFGASLYSVKTTRKRALERAQSDDNAGEAVDSATDETPPNIEGSEVAEEAEPVKEEETVVEPRMVEHEEKKEKSSQISSDTVSPSTTSLVKEESQTKRDQHDEDANLIIQFLDAVGSNPEVVFGFLGSSLAFLVSEDILISGITFAWVFDLFQESDYTRAASVDEDDVDEEETVTAVIVEESEKLEGETEPAIEEKNEDDPVDEGDKDEEETMAAEMVEESEKLVDETEPATEEENKDDTEVIIEDYRPEELMNAEGIASEESPKKVEEIIEEISADTEAQAEEATKEQEEEPEEIEDTNEVVNGELNGAGNVISRTTNETEVAEGAITAQEDVESIIGIEEEVDIQMDAPDHTNGAEEVDFSRIEAEERTEISIEEMAYKVVMDLGLLNRASTTFRGENESDK